LTEDAIDVEILTDCRPTNIRLHEKGQAPYYAGVVLCIERGSGFILSSEIVAPGEDDRAIVEAGRNALQAVRDQVPAAHVTFAVRQECAGAALTAAFGDEVTIATTCDFGPWDDAYVSFDERMGSGAGIIPHLWRGDITEPEVARFHEAAARFYRARPWRLLSDLDPIELPDPAARDGKRMVVIVMGSAGIARGIAILRSMKGYQALMAQRRPPSMTYVSFERLVKVPHTLVAEAEEHGWTVVNKSAFPLVTTTAGGRLSDSDGHDLRRATAALEAVVGATEFQRIKSERN